MNETIESNKLIAKFMGNKLEGRLYINQFHNFPTDASLLPTELLYNESWDWLMPVISKICETGEYWVQINYGGAEIGKINEEFSFLETTSNSFPPYSIEPVYKAVVMFIEYYNKKHNP